MPIGSRCGLLLACLIGVLTMVTAAAPAQAIVSCSFNAGTHVATVYMTGDGNSAAIRRSGVLITVNGSPCGGATVTTTARIRISGTLKHQQLVVDLSGGPFGPGWLPWKRGILPGARGRNISEIKFAAYLDYGTPVSIVGSPGNDYVLAGTAGVELNSDDDPDLTITGGVITYLEGFGGNDVLYVGGDSNTGGPLTNGVTILGDEGDDGIIGGAGNDRISDGAGDDDVRGGGGNDVFLAGPGRDSYTGASGDDTLKAGASADGTKDSFDGGDGTDTADYSARTQRVCLAAFAVVGSSSDFCDGGIEDRFAHLEVLVGGKGNDTLLGENGNYPSTTGLRLVGGPGHDRIQGTPFADVLEGGAGNDEENGVGGDDLYLEGATANGGDDIGLIGGKFNGYPNNSTDTEGRNTVDYSQRTGSLSVTLDALQNDGEAGEHDNVHSGIHVILGGSGNDTFVGGAAADTIFAGAGNDSLTGKGAQDILHGGAGNDTYHTVDGLQDFIFTGPGSDSLGDVDVGLDAISPSD